MKKIPTLFKREFENHKVVKITDEITEGLEWVLHFKCIPTVKWDGACCCIMDGKFYKRYDAKKGKTPPEGAIPCCEPDPVTGHHPHWVKVDPKNPADIWFMGAYIKYFAIEGHKLPEIGCITYEAVGKHFNSNPYSIDYDTLIEHGKEFVHVKPDFESIKRFLEFHVMEGIVFWYMGEPVCKIKRSDFGLPWGKER